jgi:aspartokinase
MITVVQKYGGSSVSTPDKIKSVAQRVVDTASQGYSVVVVVSAMGDTTNQLLSLAHQVSRHPQRRELDMLLTVGERISMSLLSMAIQELGHPAVSFTGSQSGIITTNTHTNARIIKVRPYRILEALNQHQIVIIAGFQGVSEQLEITSLGRGGSDTTAVALAAALNADYAEICSDVDGIYSTDPRQLDEARHIAHLRYEEMQSLADSGAKVLNAEAVEWARRNQIEIRCVSTHDHASRGTFISTSSPSSTLKSGHLHDHPQVLAITHHPGLYYIYSSKPLSVEIQNALGEFSLSEIQIRSSSTEWHAWVPKQNLHHLDQFHAFLNRFNLTVEPQKWTTLSVIGRSLLGVHVQSVDASQASSWVVNTAEGIINDLKIEVRYREYTSSYLRWTLPMVSIDPLISSLHHALIHEPKSVNYESL